MNILKFLNALKNSFPDAEKVYTTGACYKLYKILKTIYNDAEAYYDPIDCHVYTLIDNKYYDINGLRKKSTNPLIKVNEDKRILNIVQKFKYV